MTYTDLLASPREIHEAWACCDCLFRLGFDRDFVLTFPDPRDGRVKVQLRFGTKLYEYDVGPCSLSSEEFLEQWATLQVELLSDAIPREVLNQAWDSSTVKFEYVDIVDGLHEEGIRIPALDDDPQVWGMM